jgi:V/A-type H+-transporting ATPase subunit I
LETDRILRSVYFEEIELLEDYLDRPSNMIEKINNRMMFIDQELEGLRLEAQNYHEKYGKKLMVCYAELMLELQIEQMKKLLAVTNNYVYVTGWVSESDTEAMESYFGKYGSKIVFGVRDVSDVTLKLSPPTKLKNNWLFKPFEILVNMYGTPAYDELDPTSFVGLAYMLLFGAMFGDLGQGLLLVLAGYFLKRKSEDYGGILMRIGLFSAVFGFFYDSLFGYEHLISKVFPEELFIRPMENMNSILIAGVISGLGFLMISYVYSIVNKLKKGDIQEGIFGRNGIVGVVLFLSVLFFVGGTFLNLTWVPTDLLKVVILISILLMFIREPLANKLKKKKRLYHESASEYYVESGFELLETFLGMLSNTLSFIRVGAFALNHVGLFLAFHTMASLIGTITGEVTMFILGNILVLGLEGLIVLIQGLRLVYYEMFSKYYTGDGMAFAPVAIENIGGER